VGHPEYYRKFGFDKLPGLVLDGVPPEVFLSRFNGSGSNICSNPGQTTVSRLYVAYHHD
jgi:hypothetical protein